MCVNVSLICHAVYDVCFVDTTPLAEGGYIPRHIDRLG